MKPTDELLIHIDGAARGNPGPAAYGVVIFRDGDKLLEEKGYLGTATNNVAEYTALLKALGTAAQLQAKSVLIRSDSELLVKQMNGAYRVKNPALQTLHQQAKELADGFASVRYSHVRREQNQDADRLCNEALDEAARGRPPSPAALLSPRARGAGSEGAPAPAPRARPQAGAAHQWKDARKAIEMLLVQAAAYWSKGKAPTGQTPRHLAQRIIEELRSRGLGPEDEEE